jgi:hypothetical protein
MWETLLQLLSAKQENLRISKKLADRSQISFRDFQKNWKNKRLNFRYQSKRNDCTILKERKGKRLACKALFIKPIKKLMGWSASFTNLRRKRLPLWKDHDNGLDFEHEPNIT